jgi:DNA repair photolyase
MIIKEITSKTALSPSKLPGLDYALNPYVGCGHQCMYCYVPSVLHLPRKEWEEIIYVKRNLPLLLAKELTKKKIGTIGISTVTDPYQPIEEKYNVTRYSLEQLLKYDFPIQIQTKSDLVLKDLDLINRFSQSTVMMSIGTINDSDRIILEPNTSSIKKRIQVLEELKDYSHIKTSVFLGPIYPNLTWKQITTLLEIFIDKNVSTIMIDNLHLKPGLQQLIESMDQKDSTLSNAFLNHIFTSSNWFQNTTDKIKKYIKEHSSKISAIDAF